MTKIKEVTEYLEKIAPLSYQEGYDNAGLLVGDPQEEIRGVLISLDCTEPILEEALDLHCNLIISHHPIIFKGIKKFSGQGYVERTVSQAIRNNLALYAIHTNLDNVLPGVNAEIARRLELKDTRILAPKNNTLAKLVTFVPPQHTETLIRALSDAGAGNIGNYSECSFTVNGKGTFKPNELANPTIGTTGKLEKVEEDRIEVIIPGHLSGKLIRSLQENHPYEEVAYYLTSLTNQNQEVGSGMIGELDAPMDLSRFLPYLKEKMELEMIRHTTDTGRKIKKVAVCGGAGSFLLGSARAQGADIFITADYKYHDFFEADGNIVIADIGHYESEKFTKDLIYKLLQKKFNSFALNLAKVNTNPIKYF